MPPATVVIAHGSRADLANDAHRAVCASLGARVEGPVVAAFLELAEPSLGDAIATLVADGADDIVVLPYFLYPGRHMQRDIPALVEAARAAHPDVTITLGPLFGDDPAVIDLLANQAQNAAEDR
jgi:sirohydrochlorin cobaltochelatase